MSDGRALANFEQAVDTSGNWEPLLGNLAVQSSSKMADGKDIAALSDQELLRELKKEGCKTGPVTPTTRKLLERKLAKARGVTVVRCTTPTESERTLLNGVAGRVADSSKASIETPVSSDGISSVFYGVCYAESPDRSAVFTDKTEALKAAKKEKGSRFKSFQTRREAEEFSRSFSRDATHPTPPTPFDPASSFKTPTVQELMSFRKLIEQDKRAEVLEAIRRNPKYLIASGDTPAILQVGSRYNALHVAVRTNRKDMCALIVSSLESDWFWKNYLQQDAGNSVNYRHRQFLVDMYLNTPDKGVSCGSQYERCTELFFQIVFLLIDSLLCLTVALSLW